MDFFLLCRRRQRTASIFCWLENGRRTSILLNRLEVLDGFGVGRSHIWEVRWLYDGIAQKFGKRARVSWKDLTFLLYFRIEICKLIIYGGRRLMTEIRSFHATRKNFTLLFIIFWYWSSRKRKTKKKLSHK